MNILHSERHCSGFPPFHPNHAPNDNQSTTLQALHELSSTPDNTGFRRLLTPASYRQLLTVQVSDALRSFSLFRVILYRAAPRLSTLRPMSAWISIPVYPVNSRKLTAGLPALPVESGFLHTHVCTEINFIKTPN
jgi:hypothetical protein